MACHVMVYKICDVMLCYITYVNMSYHVMLYKICNVM